MKTIYIALVIFLIMIPIHVTSQEKSIEKAITGTWVMDYDQSTQKMNSSSRSHLDSIKKGQRDRIQNSYTGRKDTYSADGSYYRLLADGRDVSGSWQLTNKDSQIEITGPDGKSKLIVKIESLKDNKMVLRPVVDDDTKLTIPVWYYTKVKS